jgi:L-fuculose-phosphate aldolase
MNLEAKGIEQIIEIGRRLYQFRFIVATEGNISIRLPDESILVTPSGVCKGFLKPEEMVTVDIDGKVLKNPSNLKPTSELLVHLAIYQERPEVRSVVHAHPPIATGFSVAGIPLEKCIVPEMLLTTGYIPIAKYGTPSTQELSDNVREIIKKSNSILLENHGAVAVGKDVFEAFYRMESLEHYAQISLVARLLGGENTLNSTQIDTLLSKNSH